MTLSTVAKIPTAFYSGYELGNGINDWVANPGGTPIGKLRDTLYGSRATLQLVGRNAYTRINVDGFWFNSGVKPKDLHDWWALLMENVWVTDPSLFTAKNRTLVFIEDKNETPLSLSGDLNPAQTVLSFSSVAGLSVGDVLFLYDYTQTSERSSDTVVITEINTLDVTVANIRPEISGLEFEYTDGDYYTLKAEAAWPTAVFEAAPSLGTAQESSLGHFRKSIPYVFITNTDRYPIVS